MPPIECGHYGRWTTINNFCQEKFLLSNDKVATAHGQKEGGEITIQQTGGEIQQINLSPGRILKETTSIGEPIIFIGTTADSPISRNTLPSHQKPEK